jgi:hypothetical protein
MESNTTSEAAAGDSLPTDSSHPNTLLPRLTFDPENLHVNQRHTKILGTLNKKTTNDMLKEYINAGMDGIRVFCDDGYDTCKRLIDTARAAAREGSRRIVVSIELMCK